MDSEWVLVGKIKDAHALKGAVYIIIFSNDISWLGDNCELLIKVNEGDKGAIVKVSSYQEFKEGILCHLSGVTNRNESEALKGHLVYVNSNNFISEPGEAIYLREVLGFHVLGQDGDDLGEIVNIGSNGIQDLLVIKKNQVVYEVPFVDDFIVEIKFEEKKIVMNFPLDLMTL